MSAFICPSDSSHTSYAYEDFRQHLIKCRALQNKTGFICKYNFSHIFLNSNERNFHENKCDDKDDDFKYYLNGENSLVMGAKSKDFILSSKFDEMNVMNKKKHSSLFYMQQPNDQEDIKGQSLNENIASLSLNSHAANKKEYQINNIKNEKINAEIPLQILREELKENNKSMEFEINVKKEKSNEPLESSSNSQPKSLKLDSLIYTLVIEGNKRLELIVRRRNLMKRLRMKEFSFNEIRPISFFKHILNENLKKEAYEKDYYIGEYTLYGNDPEKINDYENFLKKFASGEYVAINTIFKDSHNEALLICTSRTKFLSKLVQKGDIALLLFKFSHLYNKVRIQADKSLGSPWVEYIGSSNAENNLNNMNKDNEEDKKNANENFNESNISFLNDNTFNRYSLNILEKEIDLEARQRRDGSLDDEILDLEEKCGELKRMLIRGNEQYKFRTAELDREMDAKKNEIQELIKRNSELESERKQDEQFIFFEQKNLEDNVRQFEAKFNEYFEKQRLKYQETFILQVKAFREDYQEKKRLFPSQEKELNSYRQELEQKKLILETEEKKLLEKKPKLSQLKQLNNKLEQKKNFLEMHKKFKKTNIEENEDYNQDKCTLCLKVLRNVLFLPCRHLVVCLECFKNAKENGEEVCFTCRSEIKQIKKLEWA